MMKTMVLKFSPLLVVICSSHQLYPSISFLHTSPLGLSTTPLLIYSSYRIVHITHCTVASLLMHINCHTSQANSSPTAMCSVLFDYSSTSTNSSGTTPHYTFNIQHYDILSAFTIRRILSNFAGQKSSISLYLIAYLTSLQCT